MATIFENSVLITKLLALLILFVISMLLGILPKMFNKQQINQHKNFIKIFLCFAGGVLLCTTFLHLLPEVSEQFNKIDHLKHKHYSELLMCLGFFSMYFIEELLHLYLHYQRKLLKKPTICAEQQQLQHHHLHEQQQQQQQQKYIIDDHDHEIFVDFDTSTTIRIIRGLLIVLALSIHELFEGLAVGLETSVRNVWYMFGGICVHKFIISFCIGLQLLLTKMQLFLFIIYIFIYSIATPIGIGVGIWVSHNGDKSDHTNLTPVVLQGVATGTLLYVVFFEILQTERKNGLKQCFATFLGFATMYTLTLIELN